MKQLIYAVMSLLLLISCNRDDGGTVNPVDQLPPLTTEGKNTFGCLINGEVFKPQGGGLGSNRGAVYQYVHNTTNPYWYFQTKGSNSSLRKVISLNLVLSNFEDLKVQNYILNRDTSNGFEFGGVGIYIDKGEGYETNSIQTGTLIITHYDYQNRIVSGKFEFDVLVNGELVKITDGRFDMKF